MADQQQQQQQQPQTPPQNEQQQQQQQQEDDSLLSDSSSESSSDSDTDSEPDPLPQEDEFTYTRPGQIPEPEQEDTSNPETNIKKFAQILKNRRYRRLSEKEEKEAISIEELYDFPKDKENWREEDLKELWADGPDSMLKPGWDPAWADEEDWEAVKEEIKAGRDPPIAPFYLPFRKYYPAIPDNHFDITNPKDVIEELDRTEEFLRWVSYIFPDGSSYEGTVWDDLAHGKGVYVAEQGLVRYEGEWLQNNMEGHGVVEVEIPDVEPIPGSKLEAQMRAEGKIIKRDFLDPEDREWLEMDIEDSVRLTKKNYQIPFYENDEWIRQYGEKPEKGRYRYAGQWKHGRMHGCGVYEVNERPIYGRFYFGERVNESAGCDPEISAMHASIAEVAAAKARMFVNKPDGMVREERGPYGDPQHPYFYEEEDVWQAPGFINQFYEVPDYWKTYVNEVDQEREMWLNSFYKAPLRLPMPAELEYWWENEEPPEFILLNKEPEPDPNDPSKLIYTEDPVILHTPTGRIINYIEDEEHGVRLFWQPEGDVDPSKVKFLPLGFDEFYGKEPEVQEKDGFWKRLVISVENSCKPWLEKLEKWTEEQKKASEIRKQLLEKELELVEAELTLEEVLEDMEENLKLEEKEAEKKVDLENEQEEVSVSSLSIEKEEEKVLPEEKISVKEEISVEGKPLPKEEIEDEDGEEDEDDDDEDDTAPSSFGSVLDEKEKKNGSGTSSFSSLSLASCGFLSTVPSMVERSFQAWKEKSARVKVPPPTCSNESKGCIVYSHVTYQQTFPENINLRLNARGNKKQRAKQGRISSKLKYSKNDPKVERSQGLNWLCSPPERNSDNILSFHVPIQCLDPYIEILQYNEKCTILQS